jgi:hypothetical protein
MAEVDEHRDGENWGRGEFRFNTHNHIYGIRREHLKPVRVIRCGI